MGRNSKGTSKINEFCCLDYTLIAKQGLIHKLPGVLVRKQLEWRKDGLVYQSLFIEGTFDNTTCKHILKIKQLVTETDGNLIVQEMTIPITEIKSNLGKGKVLFFICPVTGRKCRKLYKKQTTNIWQCRQAFKNRLYYSLQLCSRMQSYNEKYHAYNFWIDKYSEGRVLYTHAGKPTKRHLLIKLIETKKAEMKFLAISPVAMPLSMRRLFPDELVSDLFRLYG